MADLPAPAPVPPAPRRFWFRFTVTMMVLIVATGVWAGWYVYSKGFTRKWRNYVSAELRRYGLDLTVRRITLDPFEGLVARDVAIRRADDSTGALTTVSRVALDISLTQLWRREPFLNSIDLRDATVRIPLDSTNPHAQVIEIRKVRARVLLPPGQVRVAQAEGEYEGVRLAASGLLAVSGEIPLFKEDGKVDRPVLESRRKLARYILDELRRMSYGNEKPQITVEFGGDLAKPETLNATARIETGALQRGKWQVQKLLLTARYEGGLLRLENVDIRDGRGRLHAQADLRSGHLNGQIRSDLDLAAALAEFWPAALEYGLSSKDPPKVEISVRARLPGSPELPSETGEKLPECEIIGSLQCGALTARGLNFDALSAEFSWRDGHWYLRSGRLVHKSGELRADLMNAPGQLRAKVSSTIDPDVITPLLPKESRRLMSEFSFQQPPKIEFTAEGKSILDPFGLAAKGRIELGRARFRGVAANKFVSEFEFRNLALTFRKFVLEREEGRASGDALVADFGGAEIRFDNVRSGLDPVSVLTWVDPAMVKHVRPYRWKKPPQARLGGQIQFRGRTNTRFLIEFEAPSGLDYTFAKKPFNISRLAGQLLFTEHRMQIQNLRADMFAGSWRGEADIPLNRPGTDYSAWLETDGADFRAITRLFFGYTDSEGRVAGRYEWKGRSDEAATLDGSGRMKVDQGNVFAIPFLGPLSPLLSKAAPGLGYNTANEASATFTTKGGRIESKDFVVKGKGFSMIGGGWISYLGDEKMDFRIRINAQGLPGVVLFPVSKLFEYGTQGPFSSPNWRPVITQAPVVAPLNAPPVDPPARKK